MEAVEKKGWKPVKKEINRAGLQVLKQCLRLILLLFAASAAAFFLMSLSPLDPLKTNVGQVALGALSEEQIARLNAYWGVGIPAPKRYIGWLLSVLQGDFGVSLLYRQPVLSVIGEKALHSLWLMGSAWLFSGLLGVTLGILAGMNRGSWLDRFIRGICMVIAGTPSFWLALVFLLVFAVYIPIFPIGFRVPVGVMASKVTVVDQLYHAVLPAVTLGLCSMPNLAMHTRSKMEEIMESDFILYARSRGERGVRLFFRHGMKNVLLPVITLQAASVSEIFGGSILVEQVFSYPGLGQAAVLAGLGSDAPLLLGITVFSTLFVYLGNAAADLLYKRIDPRMRRRREKRL